MDRDIVRIRRAVLAGIDVVVADTNRSFPKHHHDQFGIGVVLDGAQLSASGRGQVEAEAGNVITVNPGEVHDGTPIGRGRRWSMLYIDPDRMRDFADGLGVGDATVCEFTAPVVTDRQVAAAVSDMIKAIHRSERDGGSLESEERALSALAMLLGARDGSRMPAPSTGIRRALHLIDDDPAAPLALCDLAEAAGLTRFQIVRGIARATGLTPHTYLLQRRVQLARRRIRAGARLADAAVESGFADQSHMTRMFRRYFGYSPGTYAGAAG